MSSKSSAIETYPREATDFIARRQIDTNQTLEALAKLARTKPRPVYPSGDRPRTSRTLPGVLILAVIGGATAFGWQHFRRPHSPAAASPSVAAEVVTETAAAATAGQGQSLAQTTPASTSGLGPSPSLPTPQAAQEAVQPSAPPAPVADQQQLEAMARELAALRQTVEQFEATTRELTDLRQTVEQLTASQDQMARDMAKLATTGSETSRNAPASAPRSAAAPAHKPAPPSPPQPSSDSASDVLKRVFAPFQGK
jgi:hypothetical protein